MKLELKNVTKWYGRQCVLDQISMVLEPGLYGLLGENGAGKTTLMNIIVGLLPMSSGVVLWEGRPMEEWKNQYYNMLGFMPQDPKFYKNFRAKEFLEYMCHIKGVPRTDYYFSDTYCGGRRIGSKRDYINTARKTH